MVGVHNDVWIDRYNDKLTGRNGALSHKIVLAFDILWFPLFHNRALHLNIKSRIALTIFYVRKKLTSLSYPENNLKKQWCWNKTISY